MKVVDAGVVVGLLVGDVDPAALRADDLAAPHLLDSDVVNVLRRLARTGILTDKQATLALDGFSRLEIERYPAVNLLARMWELRQNVNAYDATYVALAEELETTGLVTVDARLPRAPGLRCHVEVLE
ncbi:type II toxin-antitoxin system VapC family toxin [Specibacter cremeus]|uniref:type II toxin-antitoxin system VapC family toxin n=1 Tax=Specibacter cremeus TaxID=1629051 RepID=UPI000F79D351|nr:type II toxin-antitoxin system VapC family toxin [Specibacter cremeus]